jgi:hypothetical protein
MRFHQTSFVLSGTDGHFLFTNPNDNTCSILLDDIYMHSNYKMSFVYNFSSSYKDNYYVAGSIVSSSPPPNGVSTTTPWVRWGPSTLESWSQFNLTGIPY